MVWSHANLSRRQKLISFRAFIMSKLQYGLSTVCLVKAQRRRLDGFHARCLRRILGVAPAFISRTSNKAVFESAGAKPITEQIANRRLIILRKAALSPEGGPLRRHVFMGAAAIPTVGSFIRRRGRPRLCWTTETIKDAVSRAGGLFAMEQALLDDSTGSEQRWESMMGTARLGH